MSDERFEAALRAGLATLARDAVADTTISPGSGIPETRATVDALAHRGRRVIAAAVVGALVVGAGVIAATTRHDARPPRIETPQASITVLPPSPLGPRSEQMAVFTGRQVIIWGGRYQHNSTPVTAALPRPGTQTTLADGAAFDLVVRQWRVLPPAPITARSRAAVAWTGREMLVVGGWSDAGGAGFTVESDGAAFDPARDRWRRLPDAPVCVNGPGVWTGAQLVVSGNCTGAPMRVAAFDPARNRWTELPVPRDAFDFVAAAGTLYAWNGVGNRGLRFEAATSRWVSLPVLPEQLPGPTVAVEYAETGLAVIGPRSSTAAGAAVDVFDPDTSSWHHYESPKVLEAVGTSAIGVDPDRLVWNAGTSYAWFAPGGAFGTVAPGNVSLDRVDETLLAVGDRRIFVWGGQSIPIGESGVSQPSNDGAILEIP
jgi:hypothetical protein